MTKSIAALLREIKVNNLDDNCIKLNRHFTSLPMIFCKEKNSSLYMTYWLVGLFVILKDFTIYCYILDIMGYGGSRKQRNSVIFTSFELLTNYNHLCVYSHTFDTSTIFKTMWCI